MHKISLNNRKFSGPANWDELDARGLINVVNFTNPGRHAANAPYYLVMVLFNIPMDLFIKLLEVQKVQLLPLVEWAYGSSKLTKWLIPKISAKTFTWYGPKNKLANLTGEEFIYTESVYQRYLSTRDRKYLVSLLVILYRPKRWFGSRFAFNPNKLAAAEKTAGKLPAYLLNAVALNYAGCRNLIIEKHPDIWKRYRADEHPDHPPQKDAAKNTDWSGIILDLSGDKFGTWQQTVKTEIWILLKDMNAKARHNNELNRKYPSK